MSDPRRLRPAELVRLLNSTPLGPVLTAKQLARQRDRAGLRIAAAGSSDRVDLVRFTAWLAGERHKPKKPPAEASPAASERERDAERKSMQRKRSRDIEIPPPADVQRRTRALADVFFFHQTYFGSVFNQPFTIDRREMVNSIHHAASYGGDYASAGPRGGGKTRIILYTSLQCELALRRHFVMLLAKSGEKAKAELLDTLKFELETNDLLAADFPEICYPIRALEGWASRARMQTVGGWPTHIVWGSDHIILPTIPLDALPRHWPRRCPSVACGQIVAAMGIDGPIRGTSYRNRRPDLVVLDDIDNRDSARSDVQTETRMRIITQDVAGLGSSDAQIGRVLLGTVINSRCVAAQLTDRKQNPGWRGKRFKALLRPPDREDMWEEYLALKAERDPETDPDGRVADRFYRDNKEAMDAGAVVSNPYGFNSRVAEDGEPAELSALQHFYNRVARDGWDAVMTEDQQDPPTDDEAQGSGINPALVQTRTNSYPQRVCPLEATKITLAVDLGKYQIHWCAAWWQPGAIGGILDHGVVEVFGTDTRTDEATIERALVNALLRLRDDLLREPFLDLDDKPRAVDLALVDSGDWHKAAYEFVRQTGGSPFIASKGGKDQFQAGKPSKDRRVGDHWFGTPQPHDGIWLYTLDSNYWKRFAHDRILTPPYDENHRLRGGSLSLFAPNRPRQHHAFAHHVCAEEWREEFIKGKGIVKRWAKASRNNHWLDCVYMNCVAASMVGIQLFEPGQTTSRRRRSAVRSAGATRPDGRPWLPASRER